jgi:DNA-directed RNA polymerase specialized sigma24 family protein
LIENFAAHHPRQAEVAKMRLFPELAFSEIAEIPGTSADTPENDWKFARARLRREWNRRCANKLIGKISKICIGL